MSLPPDAAPAPEAPEAAVAEAVPPAPWLTLGGGLPDLVVTDAGLAAVSAALRAGSGPVAIDAERASGYRYSARAYLLQLRREGAGSALVDPIAVNDVSPLVDALADTEWVLHAATQDLPCLAELGLRPSRLFDTELAGRLLGYPRVGLATLVEEVLGFGLRKEHSAVDWSTRPLPRPWLEYAALDVEALLELRAALGEQLVASGKDEWARQEFAALLHLRPAPPRAEPWRRTSGLHRVRGRRGLAAVRALWHARDDLAAGRDVAPGRILPDSAIVAAASALPGDRGVLLRVPGFHGRGAARYAAQWLAALAEARALPEAELPLTAARYDGPPPPRSWPDKRPAAAARLQQARAALTEQAQACGLPVENLLSPEVLRRLLWEPPPDGDVGSFLAGAGARPWQVELTGPALQAALRDHPDPVG